MATTTPTSRTATARVVPARRDTPPSPDLPRRVHREFPVTAGAPLGPDPELYAWPVAEDPTHVEAIWLRRLRAFQVVGVPLPYCRGFLRFWGRFGFSAEAALFYADSNAWAGQIFPSNLGGAGPWESVHLYDAPHDCGYKQNHRSFEDWKARGPVSAENRLLAHYWAGSRLHVHFPPWRESMRRPAEEPLIPVSMTIDTGRAPNVVFDAVFVCRSGAWVPSWSDFVVFGAQRKKRNRTSSNTNPDRILDRASGRP
ncbi:hypothetical protein [Streptomyces achromogenes]|uniref:hypothetical protein n=1 Tax=Streptomyces achromogenes TaxID=67255 RepID=UPI0036CB7396